MAHVTDTLHKDHEKVSKLLDKLKGTSDGAEKTRLSLCQQIKDELIAHTEFEEKVFYPAVKEHSAEARQQVDAALDEHDEVDQMLEEIEQMDPTSEDFISSITELEEAVLAHVKREEEKIFPIARKAIDAEAGAKMSERHDQMVKQHMQKAS